MTITPNEMAAGREAQKRIVSYMQIKSKSLILYLIPLCWIASSIVRYELKHDSWAQSQLVFWISLLIFIGIVMVMKRQTYLNDVNTIQKLRQQYGVDITFDETETSSINESK